jgi:hypothetical protein
MGKRRILPELARDQGVWPAMTAKEIDSFIRGHEWRFAKTMPHAPHWYVVRQKCRDDEEFQRFVVHIRNHGYRQRFGRAYYTCFDWPVDGVIHKFWTMGAPLQITIIINRAIKE